MTVVVHTPRESGSHMTGFHQHSSSYGERCVHSYFTRNKKHRKRRNTCMLRFHTQQIEQDALSGQAGLSRASMNTFIFRGKRKKAASVRIGKDFHTTKALSSLHKNICARQQLLSTDLNKALTPAKKQRARLQLDFHMHLEEAYYLHKTIGNIVNPIYRPA